MKIHHLILLSTALFICLFYEETPGLNVALFGLFLSVFTFSRTSNSNRTSVFKFLFLTSILSCVAFAWFRDFPSLLAVFSSLIILQLKSRTKNVKPLLALPILFTTLFTFFCRFFDFSSWLPKQRTKGSLQKIIAVLFIPFTFLMIFFAIYTYGSDHFANFFSLYELDFNFFAFVGIALLGIFISFNYWFYKVEFLIYKKNDLLRDDFNKHEISVHPTFDFLSLDFERLSGIITFLTLNAMLVLFIITFNYEQFFEVRNLPSQLSDETHERVNSVIGSIVMAIVVILFYFKKGFNFDEKAGLLKILAKVWLLLNAILVISAAIKNTEYIQFLGFTYKRLGVYAFLILCVLGLFTAFVKIQKKKTNMYLFNQMTWYLYGTIIICSFINWGGFITSQNINRDNFDVVYHLNTVRYNEKSILKYAEQKGDLKLKSETEKKIKANKANRFLSKVLYYETF